MFQEMGAVGESDGWVGAFRSSFAGGFDALMRGGGESRGADCAERRGFEELFEVVASVAVAALDVWVNGEESIKTARHVAEK